MNDLLLCPYCRRPIWEDQPQYRGWHSWCDEQTAPRQHIAEWLWHADVRMTPARKPVGAPHVRH